MILKRYCVHDKKREDNNMGKNHKFDVVEYWIVKKNDIFRKIDRHFRGYGSIHLYEEW